MKSIVNDDFLLDTEAARKLYHGYAEELPLIDYHCHLDPSQIAADKRFSDIGEVMLAGDHYKWRAMRSHGIYEKYITGDAPWREKFRAFEGMMPYCIGNPLYHWTHLELARYFGVYEALDAESADRIFDRCSGILAEDGYSARGLMERSNVRAVCTTDDPADTLDAHRVIRESGFGVRVLPAFRPDKAVAISKDAFLPYIRKTGAKDLAGLKAWLSARMDHFAANGCRRSEHGLDFVPFREGDASAVFDKALSGGRITSDEAEAYMTDLLLFCGREYARLGWVMQIHFGAQRNNSTRSFERLGPDTGFDCMSDGGGSGKLAKLFDSLEKDGALPKTVFYSLNPNDLYMLGSLIGCFQGDGIRSKIQLGSAWWFNDQFDGMEAQLRALGNLGILGDFVGMLTDSRSFISYPRHEYFRRILCRLLGRGVEEGFYPDDEEYLGKIVGDICFWNAEKYFGF